MEINPQSSVLFTFDAVFLLSGEGGGGGGEGLKGEHLQKMG